MFSHDKYLFVIILYIKYWCSGFYVTSLAGEKRTFIRLIWSFVWSYPSAFDHYVIMWKLWLFQLGKTVNGLNLWISSSLSSWVNVEVNSLKLLTSSIRPSGDQTESEVFIWISESKFGLIFCFMRKNVTMLKMKMFHLHSPSLWCRHKWQKPDEKISSTRQEGRSGVSRCFAALRWFVLQHRLNIYGGKQRRQLLTYSSRVCVSAGCYVRGDRRRRGVKAASGGPTWDSSQLQTPVGDQVTSSVHVLLPVSCVGLLWENEAGRSEGGVTRVLTCCVDTQVDSGVSVCFSVCVLWERLVLVIGFLSGWRVHSEIRVSVQWYPVT